MAKMIFISGDGAFEIDGRTYRIPEQFSTREVFSFRSLLAPVPNIRGGTTLTAEQRSATEAYLLRRATACVIPGFSMSSCRASAAGSLTIVRHSPWPAGNRPPDDTASSRAPPNLARSVRAA
jgi:hypothetical protein